WTRWLSPPGVAFTSPRIAPCGAAAPDASSRPNGSRRSWPSNAAATPANCSRRNCTAACLTHDRKLIQIGGAMTQHEIPPSVRWQVPVGEEQTSALLDRAEAPPGNSALVLAHGASTNMEHRTLSMLAARFVAGGLNVVRFNFLYMEKK